MARDRLTAGLGLEYEDKGDSVEHMETERMNEVNFITEVLEAEKNGL